MTRLINPRTGPSAVRHASLLFALVLGPVPVVAQDAPFWRPVVMGTFGMVAAEHPLEAMAGMQILEAGGNAFDAAAAVFYMTTVVEQHQAGMGGDAFILAYAAEQQRVVFINGTGGAPALATAEYFDALGGIPDAGPDATDVPGAVGGFDVALRSFGTMSYEQVLAPAIRAAREGHPLDFWTSTHHQRGVAKTSPYPSSVAVLMPEGRALDRGDVFVQEDLAGSMEAIAADGASVFYTGALARRFDLFYSEMDGRLRYEDLAAYQAEVTDPVRTDYEGLDVYQSAPNSQGIVMLIALNILEGFDLRSLGHNSAEYIHLVTEAMKLAFADRNRWIADPRFVDVPTAELLSKDYAGVRRGLIRRNRAMVAPPPGDPRTLAAVVPGRSVIYEAENTPVQRTDVFEEDGETSSFSIADQFGNLVSVTHSVNSSFGSGMYVPETGIVLNNRLPYYSTDPDDLNVLAAGKRTRHTINPAVALRDGRPFLAWNTPGGDNQPQAMLQAFLGVVLFDMNVQQAVEAATVTSSAFGASMYPNPVRGMLTMPAVLGDRIATELASRGHRVEVIERQQPYRQTASGAGAVKMVMIDPATGVMYGGVAPAKSNYVLGR